MKRVIDPWVFLIGFSGSGKTSAGRLLARRLKRPFYDLDAVIEKNVRRSISEIFTQSGEGAFRRLEVRFLRRVLKSSDRGVVALGGGAFETGAVRAAARQSGTTVYLSCSVRELERRLRASDDRPLLRVVPSAGRTARQGRYGRIRRLLALRLANYRSADLILSTTGRTPAQAAGEILRRLERAS